MTPAHEVKCSYKGSLVSEKSPVNEVRGGAIFYFALDGGKLEPRKCDTFSVTVHFCELKQGIGVVGLRTQEMIETLRICK